MTEELKSMYNYKVWDLVELRESSKQVHCKQAYKTKHDTKGNIERYKAIFIIKGIIQRNKIYYKETFHFNFKE